MTRILIPMAGGGTRFAEKGYLLPKPLLPVMGEPMCVMAARSLPESAVQIFIIQKAHEKEFGVKNRVLTQLPHSKFIEIDGITEGQAVTCLKARDMIYDDEELIIGACDNGMIFNQDEFNAVKNDADAIVFTFRNSKAVLAKPEAYGWVEAGASGVVKRMSVKVPISNTPINDPAVVGAFWFKKGKYFVDAAEKMIGENRRINGEFYVDECLNDCLDAGLRVKIFDINAYLGWGTPADYETFVYWNGFFGERQLVGGG